MKKRIQSLDEYIIENANSNVDYEKEIRNLRKKGARGFDIIKYLADKYDKSTDEIVSDLEKKSLIGLTENVIDEKLFQEQIPYILNLKPGDVIYAKEDFTEKDINYARMGSSKLGKITKLNQRNWVKHQSDELTPWNVAKKDDIVAVIISNGKFAFVGGWCANINNDYKTDLILSGLNILLTDEKIGIRKYNKNNEKERKLVFKHNLYYPWDYSAEFTYNDLEMPRGNMKGFDNYTYDISKDILQFEVVYRKDGERIRGLRIKNASIDKDLKYDDRYLFEI